MRTSAIAILGAPIACWAAVGCLALLGIDGNTAIGTAIAWGAVWLAVAQFGRMPRFGSRRARAARVRSVRGGRALWSGAVLSTLFLPVPLYLLTLMFDRLGVAPATVGLPMFAMLAVPAPLSLWWMAIWPSLEREEEVLQPLGWNRYTPHAPAGVVPPRRSGQAG